jgi:hypothetical protein
MSKSNFQIYSLGTVATDKPMNELYCDVTPLEITQFPEGDLSNVDIISETSTDAHNNTNISKLNKSNIIRAKWIAIGETNRLTPPDLKKGATVLLYNFSGTDQYFWTPIYTEPDIRTYEKVIYFFSNKASIAKNFINKGYSFIVDTKNKYLRLYTSKNDKELTDYEISLDTANGIFSIEDGNKNTLVLTSKDGRWTITSNKSVDIKTKYFSVNNGGNELIHVLIDLLDAMLAEAHIGNLGTPTTLSPESKSKYNNIKTRLNTFVE